MRRAEQQTERVLPQNEVAEISVLGAILQNAQAVAEAIEVLQPEDFFTSVHQNVFAACQHLFNANGAVDIVTVGQEMMRRGTLERATYLMELVDAVPTAANVRHHAAIVKEKATMRRIIESGQAIVARAYEDQDEASAVLDWAEQQLFNVSQGRAKASFIEVKTLLRPVFEQMEAVYERKEAVTGIATSFARLDEMTTGFQASDLVVLAARPSMGKTSFALNLADHVATTTQTPVAVFSLEMTKEQLVQRLLCARARVESRKIRTGYIRDVDWPRLTAAAGVLSGAPIYIDDSSAQSVLEMRAKARRLKSEKGLGLVIIDYLQLITGMRRHEGRVQEVSEISRSLKMMAKDLGVPVVALSQLSRAVEQRQPPRPQLSDLRDSGSIEQDADVVVFLYRPAFYQIKDRDEEEKDAPPIIDNTTEVIVGKQRNGPTGTVYLAFLQDFGVFVAQERKREL